MSKQVNVAEKVSEVRVAQLIEEEKVARQRDPKIQEIVDKTNWLIRGKELAARLELEDIRREIRNDIVVLNLRLVTQVLKKYGSFSQDKYQNGCIGLLKAAEQFQVDKEVPFANFACFCIETEIRMAWGKQNRAFEGKAKGFLDYIDEPSSVGNGDQMNKHEMIDDPFAAQEFDDVINSAELDELFYQCIVPSINECSMKSTSGLDLERWKELELQYFFELGREHSQAQRLTLSAIAEELGTVTQNVRSRHQKVLRQIRQRCIQRGWRVEVSGNGRARVVHNEDAFNVWEKSRRKGGNR
ncbi:RNA polymerase sigma-28 factor precursor [compost metagenome]